MTCLINIFLLFLTKDKEMFSQLKDCIINNLLNNIILIYNFDNINLSIWILIFNFCNQFQLKFELNLNCLFNGSIRILKSYLGCKFYSLSL